jgi:hypothetical protein
MGSVSIPRLTGSVLLPTMNPSYIERVRWETPMITEVVLWQLADGMSKEEVTAKFRASVPAWQSRTDLIHKAFLFDEASRRIGGVYLWKTVEAAKEAHGPAFQERIRANFGATPEFQYFETPIVIDNRGKQVFEAAA